MSKTEIRKFDAEVGKVLNLMINSLYTNKDIFLRELISNAADACDKLRYEASKSSDLRESSDLKITISIDAEKKELAICDNGIGMNKRDLIENLGTIARSGTQKFLEQLGSNKAHNVNLIGQFGVGFYSAFMVAEEITVKSRKARENDAWIWQSKGTGEFSIAKLDEKISRGTQIILKLKEDESIYADQFRIQHIIQTYSDHISIPIELQQQEKVQTLNSSSALWTKSKSDISEKEYEEFYKKISSAGDKPWLTLHNKSEGAVNYTSLLFIPSSRTFDLFHPDRKTKVKLYINRVFINDEGIDLIPAYLRFLRGIVDSNDLPLNISRETLQHNAIIEKIKKSIVKRVVSELEKQLKNSRDSYIEFWKSFGGVLKEGLCEHLQNNEDLLNICLFKSLNSSEYITINEYIEKMKDGQDAIYYISGDDEEKARSHPQLEGFQNKEIDVLLFTDTVDDFWVNVISQYQSKPLKSITRTDIDLEKIESKVGTDQTQQHLSSDHEPLLSYLKKTLGTLVKDVKVSKKLASSPACLAVDEGSMDIRMEKFFKEQKQMYHSVAKILEINVDHAILKFIANSIERHSEGQVTERLAHILFDQACIVEGVNLNDSGSFVKRMNDIIIASLS